MAISMTWSANGVEIHIDGDFPNQMVALNKMLTNDPRSRTIRTMLIDVLAADSFQADAKLLGAIVELDVKAYEGAPRMQVAVVTDSAAMVQIVQAYAATYKMLNPGGAEYKLFADRPSARAWLKEGASRYGSHREHCD